MLSGRRKKDYEAQQAAEALAAGPDALVAVGIVLGVLVDELRLSSGNGAQWSRLRRPALLWSMAAAALSVAIVAYFVRPAADVIISSGQSTRISTRVGGELARAIVPVPDVRPTWWGSSWTVNQLGTTTAGLLGAVVFGVAVWSVRRSIPGLVTLLTTTVLVLGLGALTGQTALHMGGHILIGVVAASWVYFRGGHRSGEDAAEQARADRSHVRSLAVVLAPPAARHRRGPAPGLDDPLLGPRRGGPTPSHRARRDDDRGRTRSARRWGRRDDRPPCVGAEHCT